MNNKLAVLFDLDGTLLDTAPDLAAAANHVLAQHQQPLISLSDARTLSSHGAMGLLGFGFGESWHQQEQTKLRQQLLDFYQSNICIDTNLFPGIQQTLAYLDATFTPWGIVTNKPESLSRQLLAYFTEFASCATLVGGDTVSQRKPHPEPMLHACQQLKVAAQHCLYVGDALRDIEAGNNTQMTTILAEWGYISENDNIHTWQADLHCQKSEQLEQLIAKHLAKL